MSDYSKMIEHIKLSEIRVASITKEIKEYEAEIKKLDEESELMKSNQKQLKDELEYKRKIVKEKEWELLNLERLKNTWSSLLEEKKALLVTKEEELESMQKKVWDTRRAFYNTTLEFINNSDFLSGNNMNLAALIKNQEEKMVLLQNIEELDENVNRIEKEYNEVKSKCDLLQHLEKQRANLLEFEQSPEVLRLQNRISSCNKELESLENELSKYHEIAVMRPQELMNLHQSKQGSSTPREDGDDSQGESYFFQDKRPFIKKMPRFQLKTPSSLNESFKQKENIIAVHKNTNKHQ